MATVFERVMNTARPHLPGAVDDAIRQELFEVVLEFLKLSTVWRETLEVSVPAYQTEVFIQPFAGRIESLMHVKDGGSFVNGAIMPEDGVMTLPEATSARRLHVTVSLSVTDPLTRDAYPIIPEDIVRRHHQGLLYGVLARMMAQPSKPYTNAQMAPYYMQRFRGEASRARNAMNAGNTPQGPNWRFPRFA